MSALVSDTTQGMTLDGVRVLDMTRVIAGPLAGQTLGDLGADVIKVERVNHGDELRVVGPPWLQTKQGEAGKTGTYFTSVNRNKRSLTIDFRSPEGRDILRDLVAKSDVLIENYRPGTLGKYGLGYDDLKKINPRLIFCSITGFGQTGPYSSRSGYDYLIQAMAGVMNVTGLPDGVPGGGPMRVGVPNADTMAGLQATIAILSALLRRGVTGQGQSIDVSLLESQLVAMHNPFTAWFNGQVEIGRSGNDHPAVFPYGVFGVSDGHIVIATTNDTQFAALAKVMNRPEWAEDPRFATNAARMKYRPELTQEMNAILGKRTRANWVELLNAANLSCGPVQRMADLEHDPHLIDRGSIVELEDPDHGTVKMAGAGFRLSESDVRYRSAPPALGAHTDEILQDILGLSKEQIDALRSNKVI